MLRKKKYLTQPPLAGHYRYSSVILIFVYILDTVFQIMGGRGGPGIQKPLKSLNFRIKDPITVQQRSTSHLSNYCQRKSEVWRSHSVTKKWHFWDVMPCNLEEINVCFGGTYPVSGGYRLLQNVRKFLLNYTSHRREHVLHIMLNKDKQSSAEQNGGLYRN